MWMRAVGVVLVVGGCSAAGPEPVAVPEPVAAITMAELVAEPCAALEGVQVTGLGYRSPGTAEPVPDSPRLRCRWDGDAVSASVGVAGPATGLGRPSDVGGVPALEVELVRSCTLHVTGPEGGSLVVRAEADTTACGAARDVAAAVLGNLTPDTAGPEQWAQDPCSTLTGATVDLLVGSREDLGTPGAGTCRWTGPQATVTLTVDGPARADELAADPDATRALIGDRVAVERPDGAGCTLVFDTVRIEVLDTAGDGRRACARARVAAGDLLG